MSNAIKKMSATVAKFISIIAGLEAAALTAAENTGTMVIGKEYTIITGRAETRAKVKAVLVAQRVTDKGVAQYRFSVGEGFDQRFFDCIAAQVVLGTRTNAEGVEVDMLLSQVGGDTPEQVAAKLATAKVSLAEAEAALAAEEAKNALVDGQNYTIKLPAKKGEEAVQVRAVLLGQTTEGKKVFNFYYGAGVDARTVLRTFGDVVLPEAPTNAAPVDEAPMGEPVTEQPLTDAEGNLTEAGVAAQLAALGADAPQLEQPAAV